MLPYTQSIPIDDIDVRTGRFCLEDVLFEDDRDDTHLAQSLDSLGIVSPVLLCREREGRLYPIDGIKRIRYAKKRRLETVHAVVLPEKTPVTGIIHMIFSGKRSAINASVINKIQFICFALSSGASESWIPEHLCRPLGFKPHSEFLGECERMNALPREIKRFCHEKRFSRKQILNLTNHPEDLLARLMDWKSELHLTASVVDEIASNLRDYLRANEETIEGFLSHPDIADILMSSLDSREKTIRLRRAIRMKRFPVLTEANRNIQKTVESLNLPEGVTISWDTTLENRAVDIRIHINDAGRWSDVMDALNSNDMKAAVRKILDEL